MKIDLNKYAKQKVKFSYELEVLQFKVIGFSLDGFKDDDGDLKPEFTVAWDLPGTKWDRKPTTVELDPGVLLGATSIADIAKHVVAALEKIGAPVPDLVKEFLS